MEHIELRRDLVGVVGSDAATFFPDHNPDDLHDESLHVRHAQPFAVVRPSSTDEVANVVRLADLYNLAITARGSGTGLSGAATPVTGGIVVSFERMNRVLRVDPNDHVVVVQPGITLRELNEVLAPTGLRYPVYPGSSRGRSAAT